MYCSKWISFLLEWAIIHVRGGGPIGSYRVQKFDNVRCLLQFFRQCNCQKSNNFFFSTISVMSLPRTNCNNFFFLLFRQYHCHKPIATIFFSSYFGNAIVTNQWPLFFFLRNDMCTPFLQQILNGSLLLVVIVGLKK